MFCRKNIFLVCQKVWWRHGGTNKGIVFVFVCVAGKTTEQNSYTRPGVLNKRHYHIETSSFDLIGTKWLLVTAQ